MKVGDTVRVRHTGQIGLVVEKRRMAFPDGNPNGDFVTRYRYQLLFGGALVTYQGAFGLEVISESG